MWGQEALCGPLGDKIGDTILKAAPLRSPVALPADIAGHDHDSGVICSSRLRLASGRSDCVRCAA